jgi:very-short-patch-repair endonuclease
MKNEFPRLEVSESVRRKMVEVARQFRKEATESERILWQALRGKKLDGLKFRRQQPIGLFVVDFYNSAYRLVIEVDGQIHDFQKKADHERQAILEMLGLNILRIKAELVERDINAALEMIRTKIRELEAIKANSPSPTLGEGQGEGE